MRTSKHIYIPTKYMHEPCERIEPALQILRMSDCWVFCSPCEKIRIDCFC